MSPAHHIDHLLFRDIYCTKYGNFSRKGSKDIEQTSFSGPAVLLWPLTMCAINQKGSSTSQGHQLYQVWQLFSKGVKINWADIAWSWDLPTDRCKTTWSFSNAFFKRGMRIKLCLIKYRKSCLHLSLSKTVNTKWRDGTKNIRLPQSPVTNACSEGGKGGSRTVTGRYYLRFIFFVLNSIKF